MTRLRSGEDAPLIAAEADTAHARAHSALSEAAARERRGGARVRVLRVTAVLMSVALLAVGALHPAFRHAEGHLSALFCLPLGFAVAVALAGLSVGTAWARAARWVALAMVGQAAALQLMRAGMMVGHQHYPPLQELMAVRHAVPLLVLAVQAVLVIAGAGGRLHEWLRTATRLLPSWRLPAVAAVFVLTSATLSQQIDVYVGELVFATMVQSLALITILLAVTALPRDATDRAGEWFDRLLDPPNDAGVHAVDRFAVITALCVLVAGGILAWFSYQRHPHVPDEVVYLYHARYFARGLLSMPLPPVPAAFELDLMTYEAGRWYSPVPPGWPAALAVGVLAGAPWLVNPVLNALNLVLAYVLLRDLYDRRTARIAVLLLSVSPWFVFMGMNFMTHTFTLTCGLIAAVAVARMRRGGGVLWVLPGGVAIGVMGMIRPLEGITVAVLLGIWALGAFPWHVGRLLRVSALACVAMAAGAVTLPYNAHLAGDPLTFPLLAYTDSIYGVGANALGFGANRGLGWPGLDPLPGHGFLDVLVNANLNTYSVNVELLGWSTGSLLPIALLIFLGRLQRADGWMIGVIGAIIGVHSLYWFSGGPDFGARYWYLIIIPCIALSARAVCVVAERLSGLTQVGTAHAGHQRSRVVAATFALMLVTLVTFFPWRAIDKYYHYRNMRPDVREIAAAREFGRSVVLIRGRRHPDYASAAIYNPVDLTADAPIYVWDRDPSITREALLAYEDRPVWILDGPTRTGGGFRVVAGPLTARELIDGGR